MEKCIKNRKPYTLLELEGGITLDWGLWPLVILIILAIPSLFVIRSFLKKERCPVCGSKSIKQIPKRWVTAPLTGAEQTPVVYTSHYRYRCRKCQHEWEDY